MKKLFIIIAWCAITLVLFAKDQTNITITGNDTMQFDIKSFNATAGSEFKLTFRNTGKLPKIAMGHNLVILKKGVSAIKFGQKVLAAGGSATNALPESVMSDVLAHTQLLGPGEEELITFKVPLEKGSYQYVCTFPGHFAMMRGVMEVE